MIKANYKEIKLEAKSKMKDNFGAAFVALALIPLLYATGQGILNMVLESFPVFSSITQFLLTVLIQYLVVIASLKFAKDKFGNVFSNMFGNGRTYLKLVLLALLLAALYILPVLIYIDFFNQLGEYIANTPVELLFVSQTPAELFKSFLPSNGWIALSLVLLLGIIILQVRLMFVSYLLVDEDMSFIEAMKTSLVYTKGNFFRVFFFPLSFLLWVFVGYIALMIFNNISGTGFLSIFIIIGLLGYIIIYLIPYIQIAIAVMYMNIKEENGDGTLVEETEVKPDTNYFDPLGEI